MLPAEDLKLVVEKLGRQPNELEQSIFLNLWSEHCSYRSSWPLLKNFKTTGENVIIGPGDDAAVVKFDDEYVLSIAMESHNHPSYIDPYSGAATGVGGIVRDVISMGTPPVAVLAPFYLGPLDSEKNRWIFDNILQGSADYSETIKVAGIRGESYFDERYNGNPLVNVVCVGLGKKENIMTSISKTAGNRFVLFGSKTGRDGLGGAAFASADMSEDDSPARETIPSGNAELEKRVIDATLEIIEKKLVESCRDLGASGLSGASIEMAEKGGFGFHLIADNVPLMFDNLNINEIMLSETQERMLAEIKPENMGTVMEIMKKHDVPAADVGCLTEGGIFKVEYKGKIEAELPVDFVVSGVPKREMPSKAPEARSEVLISKKPELPADMKACVLTMLSSYNLASRKSVWEKYAKTTLPAVCGESGGDAGIIKVTDKKGVAMTCGCEPAVGLLDPYTGAVMTVIENAMNIAVKGATGLCLADNLNFGNPNKPEQYWYLKQSVLGLSDAAKKLNIPVVGGNVSLYNESAEFDTAILPTPAIGVLGIVSFEKPVPSSFFKETEETVFLIGTTQAELGGSEYYRVANMENAGKVPTVPENYDKIIEAIAKACATGDVTSAHDIARGGLAKALASMLTDVGAEVDLTALGIDRTDDLLFSESPARAILTVKSTDKIADIMKGIPCVAIGKTVKGGDLKIKTGNEELTFTKAEIDDASASIEKAMKIGYKYE
ncbi:phosphoribosylformylglycinamidine synthase subunit PurL [Methanimicrococcus blatticola]|uniref:Phosphoribosylformylglycinamidine synthase subunit PurL n=1 Tax=Methanimicrococcus blatticola TaxID=91560 RepID=A0A484F4A0_9EURY|nr:phosphoribosylformylglycinamidine synthase subunit PurL [Methanimicrococcus blatticola]MBZ3935545.1 phosphoribosylformylglycinamidine synthase subunit PurL [Methanimicrococcus blatticola]MCC2509188.1 phosphoribosylformylglycinamidine synthase subunit PurL [Methanimicrococcus blatticola]TDQ69446.1 phosphoribosylformylglycinamidine synthase subunit II [Methanimicrococcus blatticola]